MRTVTFFTVCGGGTKPEALEEYRFLSATLEYHSTMGRRVILDTTPKEFSMVPKRLPPNVRWFHEPVFGSGANFRNYSAGMRALQLAKEQHSDVLVWLDCDEFYAPEIMNVLEEAMRSVLQVNTYHWYPDGKPYDFDDWHARIMPSAEEVTYGINVAWQHHPSYDGNPERHPFIHGGGKYPYKKIYGPFHHHVGKAAGIKVFLRGFPVMPSASPNPDAVKVKWPEPLRLWREKGIDPLDRVF